MILKNLNYQMYQRLLMFQQTQKIRLMNSNHLYQPFLKLLNYQLLLMNLN
jgi:hypothetical protein